MKKLDFYFKPKDASSIKSFNTSQAGVSDSLPESLPSPLDSQKPNASTHVGPPYPDIGILTEDELSKHETKVNLLKSEWEPNAYSQFTFPSRDRYDDDIANNYTHISLMEEINRMEQNEQQQQQPQQQQQTQQQQQQTQSNDAESTIYTIEINRRLQIDLTVNNLCYTVNPKNLNFFQKLSTLQMPWELTESSKPHHILDNVTFTAKSGQLLAIMGSSGSGKTSLLDVLVGRASDGEILGDIYLNSVTQNNSMIRSFSAYVKQDDRLLPHLTIKETLMFVAELKLPTNFTDKQIQDRVDSVIAELGLRHVANSKVGNAESRGVSGGERRRVSIGIQLLLDPSILFLDEPTSGLDAFTAHHLVETLARLARNNRTVIMSIHQPRSDIFELFDRVMIMTRGKVVYNGEATQMVNYFTNLGYPCPHLTNPGDFYIDLVTLDTSSEETEKTSSDIMTSLLQSYNQATPVVSEQDISVDTEEQVPMMDMLSMINKFSNTPGYFRQFSVLFRRCTRNILEDYLNLSAQFIQAFAMSFVVGLVYYKLAYTQSNIRDWFGLMYILAALYPYMVILDVIAQYHNERNYLYCELEDHLYSIGPYYFAKICSELPLHTFYAIVYVIPAYFLAGLTVDVTVFFQVFGLLYLMIYCSRALAMLSSAILPNFQLSCFFAQTFFSLFIMSAGFFINLDNIFSGLRWVSSISYLKWGFQGLVYAEIPKLVFDCTINSTIPCIENGDQAIKLYAMEGGSVLESSLAILGSIFAYLFLYFICLRFIPQKPHQV